MLCKDGNQTSRTQNGITQSRTFDAENRMVGLDETRADLSRTTDDYIYDGKGKRLIKVSNERGPGGTPLVTTRTLYIGNLYEEEIPNGQNARAYIVYYMLGGKMVGLRRANQQGNTDGQFRVVGDMLGSTTLLVDTSTPPQVVQRQYYKPYGEVAFSWGKCSELGWRIFGAKCQWGKKAKNRLYFDALSTIEGDFAPKVGKAEAPLAPNGPFPPQL